ncbi:unnamed protein product, partial [Ixodes pacificus]
MIKRRRNSSINNEVIRFPSFKDGFQTLSTFHRCLGYSFFTWEERQGITQVIVSVWRPYLLYALCSWAFFVFVMLQDTYRVLFLAAEDNGDALKVIDKCILIFYFVRCIGIQIANSITVLLRSGRLREVVVALDTLETSFNRDTHLRSVAKIILSLNVLFSVTALVSILDEISVFDGYMEPLHMKITYGVFSLLFAETVCMLCYTWAMFFGKVFEAFIRCINEDIESLATLKQVHPKRSPMHVLRPRVLAVSPPSSAMLASPFKIQPSYPSGKSLLSGFSVIAYFHRLLGFCFISKDANGRPVSKIIGPYMIYAFISWALYLFVIGSDIVRVSILLQDERNRAIDKAIQILACVRCIGIEMATIVLLVTKSSQLVELLVTLEELEDRLNRATSLRATAIRVVALNVIFSVTSVLSISAEIYGFDEYSAEAYMKILYGVFSLVFAENVCMISFSWLMFFCRVFGVYLSHVNEDIDCMSNELVVSIPELAELHRLFVNVGWAFARLEQLLGVAILVSFPLNIVSAAPWGYYMLKADKGTTIFMLDLIGFFTICAEMLATGVYARATNRESPAECLPEPFAVSLAEMFTESIMSPTSSAKTFNAAFHQVNRLHRTFGYSFISRSSSPSGEDITCNRLGPYTIYFVLSWSMTVGVFVYDAIEALAVYQDDEVLDKATTLLYSVRTISIQVCSMVAAVITAPKIRKVAAELAELEARLQGPTSLTRVSRNVLAANVIYSVVSFIALMPLMFQFRELTKNQLYWNIVYIGVNLFYGQTSVMITYSWSMFFSKVFAELIRSINQELREMCSPSYSRESRDLGDVHALFYGVIEAFEQCNSTFGISLVVLFSLNMLMAAPWGYWLIRNVGKPEVVSVNFLGFMAKKTWDVLTKLLVSQEHPPAVRAKVKTSL